MRQEHGHVGQGMSVKRFVHDLQKVEGRGGVSGPPIVFVSLISFMISCSIFSGYLGYLFYWW